MLADSFDHNPTSLPLCDPRSPVSSHICIFPTATLTTPNSTVASVTCFLKLDRNKSDMLPIGPNDLIRSAQTFSLNTMHSG